MVLYLDSDFANESQLASEASTARTDPPREKVKLQLTFSFLMERRTKKESNGREYAKRESK